MTEDPHRHTVTVSIQLKLFSDVVFIEDLKPLRPVIGEGVWLTLRRCFHSLCFLPKIFQVHVKWPVFISQVSEVKKDFLGLISERFLLTLNQIFF